MIKVVIVEHDPIFRNGLKGILKKDEGISVCELANVGEDAYELCVRKRPDVVLMDMQIPVAAGDVITREFKEALPESKVLILPIFNDKKTVEAARLSGMDSHVLKGIDDRVLIRIIKNSYFGISSESMEIFDMFKANTYLVDPPDNLTLKERDISIYLSIYHFE